MDRTANPAPALFRRICKSRRAAFARPTRAVKLFERQYTTTHGAKPTKADVKAIGGEIYRMYKRYAGLQAAQA